MSEPDLVIPEDLKARYKHLSSYRPMEVAVTENSNARIYVREYQQLIERLARAEAEVKNAALWAQLMAESGKYHERSYMMAVAQQNTIIALRARVERLSAPVGEKELHYEFAQVMAAVEGTQNIKDGIERMHLARTSGEVWSLYRAIVTLFLAARKESKNG